MKEEEKKIIKKPVIITQERNQYNFADDIITTDDKPSEIKDYGFVFRYLKF